MDASAVLSMLLFREQPVDFLVEALHKPEKLVVGRSDRLMRDGVASFWGKDYVGD